MNDLDKKLKEVQEQIGCCTYHMESLEFREEIKQAFKDAGYVRVPNVSHVDDKLYIANGMDKRVFIDGTNKRLMSGQEWYDRFEKEYYQLEGQSTGGTSAPRSNALAAAKKAAGLL